MLTSFALAAGLSLTFLVLRFAYDRRMPYPPGPRRWPIVGNAFQVPIKQPWVKFAEWGKTYGDVVFLKVFSRNLVVLNSREAAIDLFEKRSAVYSERPRRMMAELCGFRKALLFHEYGDFVRQTRKLMNAELSPRNASKHQPLQEQEARQFVRRLLASPEKCLEETRRLAASTILNISYGYKVQGEDDEFVALAESVMSYLIRVITPNAFLVDAIPALRHIPSWFPGAAFQREAKRCKDLLYRLMDEPFAKVRQDLKLGTATTCFVTNNLEGLEKELDDLETDLLKWTAGGMFAGGSDTTVAVISTFFLAMLLHPEVQEKARKELDAVVGLERLPDFSDRESLPYLECILQEVLRWQPVAPLAAHSSLEDDTYRGWIIPGESVVMINVWSLTHDEVVYPQPTKFNPDRFLKENQKEAQKFFDPRDTVFGFGRRSCPGVYLADGLLWITMATVLATMKILPVLDSDGMDVIPTVNYSSGAVSHPAPFRSRLVPRSPSSAALINYATED